LITAPLPDLTEALAFLKIHSCHLVLVGTEEKIQLPPGVAPRMVADGRRIRLTLLELLREARHDEAEERAGILEYEAGFTRAEAERRAGLAATP
jgi:hypothetical protein